MDNVFEANEKLIQILEKMNQYEIKSNTVKSLQNRLDIVILTGKQCTRKSVKLDDKNAKKIKNIISR